MKKLLFVLVLLSLVIPAYSANTLECTWESPLVPEQDSFLFYGNDYTTDAFGNIFNSPIYYTASPQSYHRALNCRSRLTTESIKFYQDVASPTSCGSDFPLMYFNDNFNAVGEIDYKSYHNAVLCGNLPTAFSHADVKITDEDVKYASLGYECLYRFDSGTNARISSCNASIPSIGEYQYGVWARLFEGTSTLKCSAECTSKLDDRVYSTCATKVSACRRVPTYCDASLLGSWVNINESTQVKCSSPWNEFREDPSYVPSGSLGFDVRAIDDSCASLISQDYSVILDNEVVKMLVYVCGE